MAMAAAAMVLGFCDTSHTTAQTGISGAAAAKSPDFGPSDWGGKPMVRALFIGNSQIAFHRLHQLVSVLSESGPPQCPRIEGHAFVRGGANLRQIIQEGTRDGDDLRESIRTGDYDVVVIAESIHMYDWRSKQYPRWFYQDAAKIVEMVRESGAVPILYATPYRDRPRHAGFQEMADPQLELGRRLDVRVAAGGLAWLKVWKAMPDVDLHFSDRSHPSAKGSYISAMVIYSAITGASTIGLSSEYDRFSWENNDRFSPEETTLFQESAWAQHQETGSTPAAVK